MHVDSVKNSERETVVVDNAQETEKTEDVQVVKQIKNVKDASKKG